jgi:hypothetical protein
MAGLVENGRFLNAKIMKWAMPTVHAEIVFKTPRALVQHHTISAKRDKHGERQRI